MGACCNICNNGKFDLEALFSSKNNDKLIYNQDNINNNIFQKSDKKQNMIESNQQINNWKQQKNTLMNYNNVSIDKPDIIDEVIFDNKLETSLNKSSMSESGLGLNSINMEKELFNLINDLRTNPKGFINNVIKYKEMLQKEDDIYFITIEDNKFEFKNGEKSFDECIDFLKEQYEHEKFEVCKSMFECKNILIDKNVSDVLFVLVYNLIDINSPEDNKIRRNCLMSEEYNKLNITITKDEIGNKLYSYYFSFDI